MFSKMKVLLPLIVFISLLVSPSFSSAEEYQNYLSGKSLKYWDNGTLKTTTALTDKNMTTYQNLLRNSRYISYEFETPVDIKSLTYNFNRSGGDVSATFYDVSRPVNSIYPLSTNDIQRIGTHNFQNAVSGTDVVDFKNVKTMTISTTSADFIAMFELEASLLSYGPDVTAPNLVASLRASVSDTLVELNWTNPSDVDFSHVKILRDGVAIADNVTENYFFDADVTNDTEYLYEVISVDTTGNESAPRSITATPSNKDVTPPSEVTSITQDVTLDTITFDFVKPSDDDLDRVIIYKDGVEYDSTTGTTFTVTGLTEATSYSFKFTTVDITGNESVGVIRSVTTLSAVDDVPPSAPTGLSHIVGNGSITLDWNNNLETDLDGYFVYLDGQRVNATPIKSSHYVLNALTNSSDYQVGVTAVDKSGNESPISTVITVTPSESAMPFLTLGGYDLTDVADGVGVWFAGLWLILAFAVAIPLSFYIANRVKLLFLA